MARINYTLQNSNATSMKENRMRKHENFKVMFVLGNDNNYDKTTVVDILIMSYEIFPR